MPPERDQELVAADPVDPSRFVYVAVILAAGKEGGQRKLIQRWREVTQSSASDRAASTTRDEAVRMAAAPNNRRKLTVATILILLLSVGIASCSSGAKTEAVGPDPTIPQPEGLRDVRSPACTKAQLGLISRRTPRTRIHASERMGFLNTRKTAVRIDLDTLLVVTAKVRDTAYLAVSAGCWVTRESHIKQGVMTVVFMLNQVGYPVLEHARPIPVGAEDVGEDTYLHVVPRSRGSRR
jgi:hypothetical protein